MSIFYKLLNFNYLIIIVSALCFFSNTYAGENLDLDSAKFQFSVENKSPDYKFAAKKLEHIIDKEPNNAEAHYFLAHVIDKLSFYKGATGWQKNKLATEQLTTTIHLTPYYTGAKVLYDPYTKITEMWGALAIKYMMRGNVDSAQRALETGKVAGGFTKFYNVLAKDILQKCEGNALLFTQGVNFTMNLLYIQWVEKYRRDVSVIDIDYLNTPLYTNYIKSQQLAPISISKDSIENMPDKIVWSEYTVTLDSANHGKIKWVLKPTFANKYMLRGDQLLMNILQTNEWKRPVFFTMGIAPESMLYLSEYTYPHIYYSKLLPLKDVPIDPETYELDLHEASLICKFINPNAEMEYPFPDNVRLNALAFTHDLVVSKKNKAAKSLFKLLNKDLSEDKFPIMSNQVKHYYKFVDKSL